MNGWQHVVEMLKVMERTACLFPRTPWMEAKRREEAPSAANTEVACRRSDNVNTQDVVRVWKRSVMIKIVVLLLAWNAMTMVVWSRVIFALLVRL